MIPAGVKKVLDSRKRISVFGAVLSVLLGVWFFQVDQLGQWFRGVSYDFPFAVHHWGQGMEMRDVLIVSVDQAENLNRRTYADILAKARSLGATGVVFDVVFAREGDTPEDNEYFAKALAAAQGRVVLGGRFQKYVEGKTERIELVRPFAAFDTLAVMGLVEIPSDADRVLRRHFSSANPDHISLPWRAAELVGRAPPDYERERWIHYYGGRRTINAMSHQRFLEQTDRDRQLMAGKMVFVGWNPVRPDDTDDHPTSLTRWTGEEVAGVEVLATIYLNLIRNEWVEAMPRPMQYGLLVVFGLLCGFGLGWFRPWNAFRLGCFACVAVSVLFIELMAWKQVWFPWLIVAAIQIPAALAWSVFAHTRVLTREKEDLKVELTQQVEQTRVLEEKLEEQTAIAPPQKRRVPSIPEHSMLRCIGRGAYGEVWLARDVIGSFHAVKVVYRNTFTEAEPYEREFRGIQKYTPISRQHPGWVHILQVGRNDGEGYFYYVMELGDDEDTKQLIDEKRYTPKNLATEIERHGVMTARAGIRLGIALANALEHLHQNGLIHRDIKPSNVIFVGGEPKFTDIGLVTDIAGTQEVSQIGTEGYMAPEGPGTPAADVYSLGKLLYVACMGRDPRAFPEMPTVMFDDLDNTEAQELYDLLLKACASDPEQRIPSAAEFHRQLSQLQNKR